jgi:hypothetical protein
MGDDASPNTDCLNVDFIVVTFCIFEPVDGLISRFVHLVSPRKLMKLPTIIAAMPPSSSQTALSVGAPVKNLEKSELIESDE